MNYQIAPFWFYSGKVFLLVFLTVFLAFFGINTLIFYCFLFGLVIPVGISMRLHQLVEKSLVVIPKELSHWTVYVQGIPVQETRNVLTNPCFAIQSHLKTFFLRAFIIKFIILVAALSMLILQLWRECHIWLSDMWLLNTKLTDVWLSVHGLLLVTGWFAALWLLKKCVDNGNALLAIVSEKWLLEEVATKTDTLWYRAVFHRQGQQQPALEQLLAF